MALRKIQLDYYDHLIVRVEPRVGKRVLGLYIDIESNPIFDVGGEKVPLTSVWGAGGFKDEKLSRIGGSSSGAIYVFDLPDPGKIFKETGRFTHLFILGNQLTGPGTHIQAPFLDNFLVAMNSFLNRSDINVTNFDEYSQELFGCTFTAPWGQWINPSGGPFVGPDGEDMSLRSNDGTLRRMTRSNKRVKTTMQIPQYLIDLFCKRVA